jgi:glycerophosphoryl diester phosphodiesterase
MNILLDPDAHPVIGHRGNRAHSPENTLESLREAIALGVDAVEFDVRVTLDGVLVVFHDPTIERTTDGRGAVAEMSLSKIKSFDAGANFTRDSGRTFPWRDRGVTVPTFDEVVDTVRDVPMIIELKSSATTELIRTAVARHGITTRVVVAGFDSKAVHPLRGAPFALGATTSDALALLPRAFRPRGMGCPFRSVFCRNR